MIWRLLSQSMRHQRRHRHKFLSHAADSGVRRVGDIALRGGMGFDVAQTGVAAAT